MGKKDANPNQIIRQDGRNVFVDITNESFLIGKVHLRFARYDLEKTEGNRFVDCVDIYISFDEWLALANDALSGHMHDRMRKWKAAVEDAKKQGSDAPPPLLIYEKSAERPRCS